MDEDQNGEIDFEEFSEGLLMIDKTLMKPDLEEIYKACTWSKDVELKISSFIDIVKNGLIKNYPMLKVKEMKERKIIRKAFPQIFEGKGNIKKKAWRHSKKQSLLNVNAIGKIEDKDNILSDNTIDSANSSIAGTPTDDPVLFSFLYFLLCL